MSLLWNLISTVICCRWECWLNAYHFHDGTWVFMCSGSISNVFVKPIHKKIRKSFVPANTGNAEQIYEVSGGVEMIWLKNFRAIILQLLIPSFCLNTPFFYIGFSGAFGYFNQKLTNVSFILIATHGFFSSLFMLFVHASYREAVLECFVKIGRILGFNIITVYPERKSTIYPTRHPMLLWFLFQNKHNFFVLFFVLDEALASS